MQIQLLAVGTKMPTWVKEGFEQYQKRFPGDCKLVLTEIPAQKRTKKADVKRIMQDEGKALIQAIPKSNKVITLEVKGNAWDTPKLAKQLSAWQMDGRDVTLLVGGPEGLSDECLALAEQRWSLSNLTLPHPMVRLIIAESLYRAWSLNNNHPYHRE